MPARDRLGALEVLKEWGYTKSLNATRPLEPLVNGLDRDTFLLVEKLIHDLSDEKRKSSEGRLHIAQLKENLKLEEEKVRKVQGDIHQHSTRIETSEDQPGFGEKAVDTIDDRQKSDGHHVQQWKAQSLHQIQELERMNQALRSTLNLHSSCFAPEGQDVSSPHQTAHMELSAHLEPKKSKGKTMVNGKGTAVPKLDLFRVSEKKCKDLEDELRQMKENEASLKSQLLVTQEQLAKKDEEINCLSSLVKKVKDGNHGDLNLPPLSGDVSSTNGGDHIHGELQVLHNRIAEQESVLNSIHANVAQKQEQLIFLTDEKIAGEESLQACQNECRQLAACIKELDESMSQLSELLATRTAERDHAIACEQQAVEAQVHSEEDFKKNIDSISFELETSHAKLAMLQSELDKLMKEREEEKEKFRVVTVKLQEEGMRLKSTEKDMEQLKLLVTQLDTTREHLVEKLKSSLEQNQRTSEHCRTMETEMHRLAEEAETRNKDISNLQALIEPMGKERKHLQAELEHQLQKVSQLRDENNRRENESVCLKRDLQNLEQKFQDEVLKHQQAEAKIISFKERLSTEEEANKSCEAKYSAKILELRSVTESLTKMSCEQQLIKSDLQHVMMERENLVDELRNMKSNLSFSEQLIYSRDQEGAEMLNSYQKLCEDYEQLKLAAGQVETENQQLHFQLQSMEEHLYRRNQEVKSLEDGTQRQASEIKRLEREASLMSRSMSQQSGLLEDYRKEKASLSAQLGALKQAASELEHAHESISREVAAFATKNQFLASLAQERTQEIETLTTQYNLESERTKELERLLACVRMESKDVVREYGMMRDRSFSLEDQVRTLQVTRDVQSKEIMRLQALILHNNTTPEEEKKRAGMVSTSSQTVDNEVDSSSELSILKAKAHELEMRNISLASDLSKTVALYKECFKKLQNAEMQCNQQKREHDQILLLLSKVDEERMVLRKRCVELGSGTEPSDAPKGA